MGKLSNKEINFRNEKILSKLDKKTTKNMTKKDIGLVNAFTSAYFDAKAKIDAKKK